MAGDGQIVVSAGIRQAIAADYSELLQESKLKSMGHFALKGKPKKEELFIWEKSTGDFRH